MVKYFVAAALLAPVVMAMLLAGSDYRDRRQAAATMGRDLDMIAVGVSLAKVESTARAGDLGVPQDHPLPLRGYSLISTDLLGVRDENLVVAWGGEEEQWFVLGRWRKPSITCQMGLIVEHGTVTQVGRTICEGGTVNDFLE